MFQHPFVPPEVTRAAYREMSEKRNRLMQEKIMEEANAIAPDEK
jgi:hypothetical protein